MTKLNDLEDEFNRLLQGLICPCCQQYTQRLALINPERRYYRYVRCCNCGYEFPLTKERLAAVEAIEARLVANLGQVSCPHCHTRQFNFELRCNLRDCSCFFLARCRTCGRVFRVIERDAHLGLTRLK